MKSNVVPLSKKDHQNVRVTLTKNFEHLANQQVTPVILAELVNAGAELPVVFIKNPDTDDYIMVALMGLKENQNLLIKDGKWTRPYLPAGLTHSPLSLIPNQNDTGSYSLWINMDSHTVGEEEGDLLFNEDGSETEKLNQRRMALENYYKASIATREFIKALADLDLLHEQAFTYEIGDDKHQISGVHLVNDEKLNNLPDEKIVELHKKGYLGAIYTHLMSIRQTQRLIDAQTEQQAH